MFTSFDHGEGRDRNRWVRESPNDGPVRCRRLDEWSGSTEQPTLSERRSEGQRLIEVSGSIPRRGDAPPARMRHHRGMIAGSLRFVSPVRVNGFQRQEGMAQRAIQDQLRIVERDPPFMPLAPRLA